MPTFQPSQVTTIHQIESLHQLLRHNGKLHNTTLQDINFDDIPTEFNWEAFGVNNSTTFLGCRLCEEDAMKLRKLGAIVLDRPNHLPYEPFRAQLYTWQELDEKSNDGRSTDLKIYEHFFSSKHAPAINEALWQRIHDHAIDDALRGLLNPDKTGMTKKKCIGIMGGHSAMRTDKWYQKTAHTAWHLGKAGYYVISGGGPGMMEAANLGAYMSGRDLGELDHAIALLKNSPHYKDEGWHECAETVLREYPEGKESLAIPTWFYGHEPSNLFATHIAKYFSNSIREDTLLAISLHGVVYAPGSAGTTQEIFMDATQNHYGTFNYFSPMVFLGKKRYAIDTLIFPVLQQLSAGRKYHDLMHLTDEPEEVLRWIKDHPPVWKQ